MQNAVGQNGNTGTRDHQRDNSMYIISQLGGGDKKTVIMQKAVNLRI